ncbi:protein-L-isoaspartate(D-aspartate) O-methyltransferase [Proteobacteria bacterium 005FR1]|nr:protein-L-isoaspartate(D-aspartate) O-methyltransferase [Proteobacteria bacterium 005FR1]
MLERKDSERHAMVESQLRARGIHSPMVLEAMDKVHRESFLPEHMQDLAYEDSALPIAEGQTISQPYIVGYMIDALQLDGGERVLEVGTGSGYGAAVLAEIAGQVITVERHKGLADRARDILDQLGYHNIDVVHGDGSTGWHPGAPYDAIVVTAGGPKIPPALKEQLAVGGTLVMPVGQTESSQSLVRITRENADDFREERLIEAHFVPLVGQAAWTEPGQPQGTGLLTSQAARAEPRSLSELVAEHAEPIDNMETVDLDPLLKRIGDARVVCIGEASHGTAEFYRFRARITKELIEKKGFSFVAVEADWPDASRIDNYVRHAEVPAASWTAFTRFPTWMWRNAEVREFVDWLHDYNRNFESEESKIGFHGLDLYSLYTSIGAVLGYLDNVDPATAKIARDRYGCLTPWQADPVRYGRAAASGRYGECEKQVVTMLAELLQKRLEYSVQDGERFLDAVQNARLVANAERYYRSMYEGYSDSWNLRDQHMFDTLQSLFNHRGEGSKAVIWAHNSHLGDASKTDMSVRGQLNVGQLCRETYGEDAYLIGFGTHQGKVAAATEWGGPLEFKTVRPSLSDSWERVAHDSQVPAFMLGMREPGSRDLKEQLQHQRLERAIGVIYRPESERISHYFSARLGQQFDEYIWFDVTHAVTPLDSKMLKGTPETYPFGL